MHPIFQSTLKGHQRCAQFLQIGPRCTYTFPAFPKLHTIRTYASRNKWSKQGEQIGWKWHDLTFFFVMTYNTTSMQQEALLLSESTQIQSYWPKLFTLFVECNNVLRKIDRWWKIAKTCECEQLLLSLLNTTSVINSKPANMVYDRAAVYLRLCCTCTKVCRSWIGLGHSRSQILKFWV